MLKMKTHCGQQKLQCMKCKFTTPKISLFNSEFKPRLDLMLQMQMKQQETIQDSN